MEKYPALARLLNIEYPEVEEQQLHKIVDLQQTLKLLEQQHNKPIFCRVKRWDKPIELYEGKCIANHLRTQLRKGSCFLMEFYEVRKEVEEMEFNKYKFYKSLTEQMFDNISELGVKLEGLP